MDELEFWLWLLLPGPHRFASGHHPHQDGLARALLRLLLDANDLCARCAGDAVEEDEEAGDTMEER